MPSAVASLTRLSPSRMVTKRRGTPRRWKIAVAATASGGATSAPTTKAKAHPSTGTSACTTTATAAAVKMTRPKASSAIGRRLARDSRMGGGDGGGEEGRGKEDEEGDRGVDLALGEPRHEPEREAREHHDHRVGQPE